MLSQVTILIAVAAVMFFIIGGLSLLAHYYTLSGIKSKTVADSQHGTACFATESEICTLRAGKMAAWAESASPAGACGRLQAKGRLHHRPY